MKRSTKKRCRPKPVAFDPRLLIAARYHIEQATHHMTMHNNIISLARAMASSPREGKK